MAWYTTGTIAVSGTTVTGTGTNWLDNKQSIGAGQALLIPGSGTVKMYEIASVTSATKLTLKTSPGTIAAGQAYAILSFYTDSVPDLARRLAAQLSYYQSQMDGWQQIMTGTGDVVLSAPDGTSVTISSFAKLSADIKNTLKLPGSNFGGDANTIITAGVYSIQSTVSNLPVAANGILVCLAIASGAAVTQEFTSVSTGSATINRKWTRSGTVSGGVPSWQSWVSCTLLPSSEAGSADLNMYTTPGSYSGGTLTNAPSVMGNATAIVLVTANGAGSIVTQTAIFTSANRGFIRTFAGGAWTAWVEIITSSDARLNTINGKSGGLINGSVTCDQPFNSTVSGNYGFVAATTAADATGQTARGMLIRGSSTQYDVQIHYRLVDLQYHCLRLIQNSTEIFRANSNGACYAVSFNPTSDSRLKFNKRFIGDALSKSMTLRGMTYQIQGETKAGVIAQDAQKILPESVTVGGEEIILEDGEIINDQLSLDYAGITALNTEALKDVVKLMLECLTDPDSARAKLTELVDAINASTDDANETDMRMEWALVNQPETPPEQPVTDSANADS